MVDRTRTSGIFDASGSEVTLVGCGGIGSPAAILLAKMGMRKIWLWDFDRVSPENVATQFYGPGSVGELKPSALQRQVLAMTDDVEVVAHCTKAASSAWLQGDVVVSAVDSIAARKQIWQCLLERPTWLYYMDARMGAEQMALYTVRYDGADWYDRILADQEDENVPDLPCTAKATFYTGLTCAGLIGANLRRILTGEKPFSIITFDMAEMALARIP